MAIGDVCVIVSKRINPFRALKLHIDFQQLVSKKSI